MSLNFLNFEIIRFDVLDSTNNYAANLIKASNPEEGVVILTNWQSAGKGQRGNVWQANASENLTLSVILKPEIRVRNSFQLNVVMSLAVLDTLKEFGLDAIIKWPNDIYVGNEKIAGILIENSISGDRIKYSILGLGLNVNQISFHQVNATSIAKCTGKNIELKAVEELILNHLKRSYLRLKMGQYATLKNEYYRNMLGFQEIRSYEDVSGIFDGVILGFDEQGNLKINVNQTVRTYAFKEVKFLFNSQNSSSID